MKEYSAKNTNFTKWEDFANSIDFKMILSDFLFSPDGLKFKSNFKFDGDLYCNQAAPTIKVKVKDYE